MIESLILFGFNNALFAGLLALVAFLLTRIIRSPPFAHAIWLIVLLKLVTPPIVPFAVGFAVATKPSSTNSKHTSNAENMLPRNEIFGSTSEYEKQREPTYAAAISTNRLVQSNVDSVAWSTTLAATWFLGSSTLGILVIFRTWRFSRLIRRAGIPAERIVNEIRYLSKCAGLRKPPKVVSCNASISPMVIGLPKATLIIPGSFVDSLESQQRRSLLAHELAHLRRGDHILAWVVTAIFCIQWWNPVVWIARRELRRSADKCCDGLVLNWFPGSGATYAETLMLTLDFVADGLPIIPPMARGFGEAKTLRKRFELILGGYTTYQMPAFTRCFVVALASIVLALSPVEAQPYPVHSHIHSSPESQTPEVPSDAVTGIFRVNGRIVDHRGVAVKGAEVVLLGSERIRVDADRPHNWYVIRKPGQVERPTRPPSSRTGEEGEFSIGRTNIEINRLAVISKDPLLWVVALDKLNVKQVNNKQFVEVQLPESGSLSVKCDLPGKPEKVPVHIQLRTFDQIDWETDVLGFHMGKFSLNNPGETIFEHLPPARYAIERVEETKTGERASLLTLSERQLVNVESDKRTTVAFNRSVGRSISGQVRGLEEVRLRYAHVAIRYWGPEEKMRRDDRWRRQLTTFDVIPITSDGLFETAPIPPGKYHIDLFAIRTTTEKASSLSSDFRGQMEFVIPESGEPPKVVVNASSREARNESDTGASGRD